MRHAALDLAFEEERVHHRANIAHHRIALDLHDAGVRVDLDLAHMGGVGEGRRGRLVGSEGGKPTIRARRLQRGRVGHARHVGQVDRAVGAGDGEGAVVEFDVACVGLEMVRGDNLALVDDLVRRLGQRAAAQAGGTGAKGAMAVGHLVSVALDIADLLEFKPQPVGQQLLEDRLVALPVIVGAEFDGRAAVGVEADLRTLVEQAGGLFDGVGDAEDP